MDAPKTRIERTERVIDALFSAAARDVPLRGRVDVERLVYALAKGFSFKEAEALGITEDVSHLEKMFDACAKIRRFALSDTSRVRTRAATHRLCALLDTYESALARYLTGDTWVSVARDTGVLAATLDGEDVRSVYQVRGYSDAVSAGQAAESDAFIAADDYRDGDVFNSQTAKFVERGIPYATYAFLVSQFSEGDMEVFGEDIHSEWMIDAIAVHPENLDYVAFIVRILKTAAHTVHNRANFFDEEGDMYNLVIKHQQITDQYALLYNAWKKNQRSVDALLQYTRPEREGDAVTLFTMTLAVSAPWVDHAALMHDLEKYSGSLSSSLIVRMHLLRAPCEGAAEYMKLLPPVLQDENFVYRMVAYPSPGDEKKLQSFVSVWADWDVHVEEQKTFDPYTYWWYQHDIEGATRAIRMCKARGVRSLDTVRLLATDKEMSLKESLAWENAVGLLDESTFTGPGRKCILEWKKGGLLPSDIVIARELWSQKEPTTWHDYTERKIRALLKVKQSPTVYASMLETCSKYNILVSEIVEMFAKGYTKEDYDLVEETGIGYAFQHGVELAHKYPDIARQFATLDTPELQREYMELRIADVEQFLKEGKTLREELLERADRREKNNKEATQDTAVSAMKAEKKPMPERQPDDYEKRLDKRSDMHVWYVQLFEFFNVSADYMSERLPLAAQSRELSDTIVDHIILCAYIEGVMPPECRVLVDKYRIGAFTRYPVEVLEEMCTELTEDDVDDVCLVLVAKTDWMSTEHISRSVLRGMSKKKRILIHEVGTIGDVYRAIRETGEECRALGGNIPMIMISGHGDQKRVSLGFPHNDPLRRINRTNVETLAPLREYFTEHPQLLLNSCWSEGSLSDGSKNITERFKEVWSGLDVWGSEDMAALEDVEFDSEGRVDSVTHRVT